MSEAPDLTGHWAGYLTIFLFVVAYSLVVTEEFTRLRKSKPVVIAAGLIWLSIALARPEDPGVQHAFEETLTEYAELFLFLLVAMTYVNAMTERNVFGALRDRLIRSRASYRTLFWATGMLTFMLSAWIDNLTAALVMSGVALAVVREIRLVSLYCINIVVASNAGGAWSAFGDITTLMVWQAGKLGFFDFFQLFPASLVSWLVPAAAMHFRLPRSSPEVTESLSTGVRHGGLVVIVLFVATLLTAISFHSLLGLPPVLGMMTGLGYLQIHGFLLMRAGVNHAEGYGEGVVGDVAPFDMFRYVARAEWDTLLFFYGIILCVGGLGVVGYLAALSSALYGGLGATSANVLIGAASAVIDNIPIMAAVLEMNPTMDDAQWLLITFTAGVGGSMLAIGSAAGVALLGQARGHYTFFGHLRWTPAIAAGYAAGIVTHLWLFA